MSVADVTALVEAPEMEVTLEASGVVRQALAASGLRVKAPRGGPGRDEVPKRAVKPRATIAALVGLGAEPALAAGTGGDSPAGPDQGTGEAPWKRRGGA